MRKQFENESERTIMIFVFKKCKHKKDRTDVLHSLKLKVSRMSPKAEMN